MSDQSEASQAEKKSDKSTPVEHRFPCEACGSDLRFDPTINAMICDHCGNREPIEARGPWKAQIKELDFLAAIASELPEAETEDIRVISCPSCAAKIEFEPNVHSTECPFCATPVVTDTGHSRLIKPRGLLPFMISEPEAHRAMQDWLGKLWFAPRGLEEYARHGRKLQGIYVPYWTFDAQTNTRYQGERGTVYFEQKVVYVDGKRQVIQVPRTRWRRVSGRVSRFFDDVLILATKSLPKRYTDALSPWDLSDLEPYQPQYLAGFRSEAYTVEIDAGFKEAQEHMEHVIRRDIRFDIGGDRQRIHAADTDWTALSFKHILLPIWIAAYRYRGKSFRFVVNGQTGRVQGERPWSYFKIALAAMGALILAGAVGYVVAVTGQQ